MSTQSGHGGKRVLDALPYSYHSQIKSTIQQEVVPVNAWSIFHFGIDVK